MLRGIDVSHHQGDVNWATLKARYGLTWGAAKATEGLNFKDSQFPSNWQEMKANGLVRMAYHFARPDNNAIDDAKAFLAYIKASGDITTSDITVMDMESNPNNLPLLTVRDWLIDWADYVTSETGRKPFLYCGSGYMTNNATKDIKPHYAAWWWPRYPSEYSGKNVWPNAIINYPQPNNWGSTPDIWQFSQSFPGGYDANIANMTLTDLRRRGIITLNPGVNMALTKDDQTYIDQRLQAYFLWQDMRNRRFDLLLAKANGSSAEVIALAQEEYENAYTSWKSDTNG